MARWQRQALMLAALATAAVGCTRSDLDEEAGPAEAPKPHAASVRPEQASTGADDAVRDLIRGVRAKDPEAFWTFLPPGYRSDVNELVRTFAHRMDDKLYTRFLTSARRLTKVLREKKAYILDHPRIAQADEAGQIDAGQLAAHWDGFVSLVETLIGSEQVEIEPLKTFDGRRFLQGPGRALMQQIEVLSALSEDDQFTRNLEKLENVTVTLVSESADGIEAVVRLESPDPEEEARDIPFVKVEGHWIPRDLAESWDSKLAGYRREVEDFTSPENLQIARDQFEPLLDQVDVVVAQLDEAESQEEFHRIVQQQILGPLEFLTKGFGGAPDRKSQATGGKKDGMPESVTVIIRARVEDDTALHAQLQQAAGGQDLTVVRDGDATRIEITNVGDVQAFARRIEVGRVTKVDPKSRTITVELTDAGDGRSGETE